MFIDFILGGWGERESGETSISCLPYVPWPGLNLQLRYVLWLGLNLQAFGVWVYAPTNWATWPGLFFFCLLVYFAHQIPHISEIIWYLSFPDWLISFSIIISRSIHAIAKHKIFLWLSNWVNDHSFLNIFLILTWGYVFINFREKGREGERERHLCEREKWISCLLYAPSLGIKLAVFWCMRDTSTNWATGLGLYHSFFYLLIYSWGLGLLPILAIVVNAAMNMGCIYSFKFMFRVSLNKFPEVESLGHKAVPFSIFWVNSMLLPTVVAPICIPTNSEWGFPFLHIFANTCLLIDYNNL